MESNQYVVISKEDLSNLIFQETKNSNDKLFKGIAPFLYGLQEDMRTVMGELEYLKTLNKTNTTNNISVDYDGDMDKNQIANMIQQQIQENQIKGDG